MSLSATSSSYADVRSDWIFERDFALRLFECANTPVALRQHLLLQSGDVGAVCDFSIDPSNYQEPRHFAEDYQVAEILRKSLNIPGVTSDIRERRALDKFLVAEAHNAVTNDRLFSDCLPDWFGDFSYQVLRILGDLSPDRLNGIAERGKFGPGVNVGVRGDGLVPSIKYEAKPVVTKSFAPLLSGYMPAFVRDYWGDNLSRSIKVVRGNGHFTVPKNWEIDRCAAKEPLWNSNLQLGIGDVIADRLLRFGVNLHDQRLNQYLAEMAWEWGLATIDLSSASDLLARVLVLLALCYNQDPQGKRWFHLLNLARSPQMLIDGDWRELEMFASMGNGFTFPLETVMFLALVRCTVPREDWCVCTAYGDDIVVPQQWAGQVVERLEYLGFKVNGKKTCLAGTFFESCGTDWFKGQNVRPFYLHKDPKSPIPYALQAANALRAWCTRVYGELPQKYVSLWQWCVKQVPVTWKRPIPKELGDVGLHVGLSAALKLGIKECFGSEGLSGPYGRIPITEWEGHVVKFAMVRPVLTDRKSFGVMAACLAQQRGRTESPTLGLEPIRGLYGRVRTETAVVTWCDDLMWGRGPAVPLRESVVGSWLP